jgi:LysM repeat protein/ABC-type branched-subunit amino acid transport system substrate-binding protein
MKQYKFLIVFFILIVTISCGQQKNYSTYKVQKNETTRSIARKLDVKVRDLLRLNPAIGRKPEVDTEILIPIKAGAIAKNTFDKNIVVVKGTIQVDSIKIVGTLGALKEEFVLHTVSKGDTFYSLTRYYNVLKTALLALNPTLEEGLKLGTVLKIKRNAEEESIAQIFKDTILVDLPLKIALLLPFRASLYDTVIPRKIFKGGSRNLTNIATDFYLGAELAIDSLRNQGMHIDFSIFDTEDRNTKINELIANNSFSEMDAVVGSIYSDETMKLAKNIEAPLVFPVFSSKQTAFVSPNIIKTSPDKKLYKEKLLSHILKRYTNENIIIVGDSTATSIVEIQQIANILKQHDSIKEVHQIIPHNGYIKQQRFLKLMQPASAKVANWVLVATDNEIIASNAVNSLISFPELKKSIRGKKTAYLVKLFGFEKIAIVDNNKLAQLEFVYVNDNYMDETSMGVKRFHEEYVKKNKAFPSHYATRGFDVMYDIVMRLASGKELYATFEEGASYRLERKFEYAKKEFSSTENKGLFLLEYNSDLSIKELK